MRVHRFYTQKIEGIDTEFPQEITLFDKDLLNQWFNVFRFDIGQKLELLDGRGFSYKTEIISINKEEAVLKIGSKEEIKMKPKRKINLFISIPKKDNFEIVVQKATEIGVSQIQPIISERTEKKKVNLERAEKISIESMEQSGWGSSPGVYKEKKLSEALKDLKGKSIALEINCGDCLTTEFSSGFREGGYDDEPVNVFVGPEGGWSENDLQNLKEAGVKFYTLGPQTLRAETAAIAACTLLLL